MKVAVVTGANGFIGKALTRLLLSKGVLVYAIVTNKEEMAELKDKNLVVIQAFFEEYTTLDKKILDKPDVFFHFAWQGVFGKAFLDYSLQLKNVDYCVKAFEMAERIGCGRFVLASTVNVLEAKKMIAKGVINHPLRATMNYSMAKLTAEMMCKTLATRSKTTSFNTAYVAMVYGPNNYSLMVPNVVMLKLMNNESPDLINGEGLYDLIYVDDVARGFYTIGEKGINTKSYYLGHLSLRTFKEIFLEIGSIINEGIELNFGVYPDDNNIDYSTIDLNAIQKDCGFEPQADFRKSILETCDWLKTSNLYNTLKGK